MTKPYLIDYAGASLGTDGCIYKAGLQSLTNVETGWGLSAEASPSTWASDNSNLVIIQKLGIYNTGTISVNYAKVDIPLAYQSSLATQGAFQVEMKISDLFTFTQNRSPIDFITASALKMMNLRSKTSKAVSTFDKGVKDYAGNACYTGMKKYELYLTIADPVIGEATMNLYLHNNTEIDADGYFPITFSWDARFVVAAMNGVEIKRWKRPDDLNGDLVQIKLQEQSGASMRNLILFDRPITFTSDVRILFTGDSFPGRDGNGYVDSLGVVGDQDPNITQEQLTSRLKQGLSFNIDMRMVSYGGFDLGDLSDYFDNTTSNNYLDGSATPYRNVLTRFLPHFCIVMMGQYNGSYNGGTKAFANLTAAVNDVTDQLTNLGIIPIWVIQNGRVSAATSSASQIKKDDIVTAVNLKKAVNDMGLVDTWLNTPSMGLTCPDTYVEYLDSAWEHPNIAGAGVYSSLIVSEIERLKASPPSYSRLAQGK